MRKCVREVLKQLPSECSVLSIEERGSGHPALILTFRGNQNRFFLAATPSDRRGNYNTLARIKRWMRAVDHLPDNTDEGTP